MRLIEGSIAIGKSAFLPVQAVKKLLGEIWINFKFMIRIEVGLCQALLKTKNLGLCFFACVSRIKLRLTIAISQNSVQNMNHLRSR